MKGTKIEQGPITFSDKTIRDSVLTGNNYTLFAFVTVSFSSTSKQYQQCIHLLLAVITTIEPYQEILPWH